MALSMKLNDIVWVSGYGAMRVHEGAPPADFKKSFLSSPLAAPSPLDKILKPAEKQIKSSGLLGLPIVQKKVTETPQTSKERYRLIPLDDDIYNAVSTGKLPKFYSEQASSLIATVSRKRVYRFEREFGHSSKMQFALEIMALPSSEILDKLQIDQLLKSSDIKDIARVIAYAQDQDNPALVEAKEKAISLLATLYAVYEREITKTPEGSKADFLFEKGRQKLLAELGDTTQKQEAKREVFTQSLIKGMLDEFEKIAGEEVDIPAPHVPKEAAPELSMEEEQKYSAQYDFLHVAVLETQDKAGIHISDIFDIVELSNRGAIDFRDAALIIQCAIKGKTDEKTIYGIGKSATTGSERKALSRDKIIEDLRQRMPQAKENVIAAMGEESDVSKLLKDWKPKALTF